MYYMKEGRKEGRKVKEGGKGGRKDVKEGCEGRKEGRKKLRRRKMKDHGVSGVGPFFSDGDLEGRREGSEVK
jgi:hypothetical protein